jgi:hypothetical protein
VIPENSFSVYEVKLLALTRALLEKPLKNHAATDSARTYHACYARFKRVPRLDGFAGKTI